MFLRSLISGVRSLVRRDQIDSELEEELRGFLEMAVDAKIREGMTAEQARRAVSLEHGNLAVARDTVRAAGWESVLETSCQDVRFALRMLRKSPGFTLTATLTLALGIGANVAIFSIVNAVLLRPLPYAHPDQLVVIAAAKPAANVSGRGMSSRTFTELHDHSEVFSAMAGLGGHQLILAHSGEPTAVSTVVVTSEFFSVLAGEPLLGRPLTSEDGRIGAMPVVVLSEGLWRTRFRGDPDIVGRSITLDQRAFTVAGVMPGTFRTPFFNQSNQIWIPLAQDPLYREWMTRPPQEHWMAVIARVRDGVPLTRVQAELDTMSARWAREFASERGWSMHVQPLQERITGDVRAPLLLLLAAVGLVLLIARVNVANLLLSRATARSTEVAVRMALGAGTGRIARQLLTECLVLGLIGAAAGTLVAFWALAALVPLLPANLPAYHAIRLDYRVLGFAVAAALVTSVLFGVAPMLTAAKFDLHGLRHGDRAGESTGPRRLRALLAVAEVALAMVLLTGAGMFMRSFTHLTAVNPGFDPRRVVKAMVSLPQFQYATPTEWAAFSQDLLDRLRAEPGMQDAAIAGPLPIVDCCLTLTFQIDGHPPAPQGTLETANYVPVSPRYFSVMSIPLRRGRLFNDVDAASSPPVALISEAVARQFFGGEDPLGRHLTFGFPANGLVSREIVGIVGDVRDASLGKEPGPMLYVPFAQAPLYGGEIVVRSALNPSAVAGAIRRVTRAIDKNLPVTDVAAMPEVMSTSVAQPRLRTVLLAVFGGVALILAAVGLFGVISHSVARRTRELGIRLTLGAQPWLVLGMIVRETLGLTLAGIAIGVPCAIGLAHVIRHLLFDVTPYDGITMASVCVLLVIVGTLASVVPARRAMRIAPVVALRCE